jgi:hypothetical protein
MIEERGIEEFLEGRGEDLPSQSLEEKGRSGVGESFPLSAVWAGEDGLQTQNSLSALDKLRNGSAVFLYKGICSANYRGSCTIFQ